MNYDELEKICNEASDPPWDSIGTVRHRVNNKQGEKIFACDYLKDAYYIKTFNPVVVKELIKKARAYDISNTIINN